MKKYHPDMGAADTEQAHKTTAAINEEYERLFEDLKKWDTTCTREDATAAEKNRYNPEQDAKIREAINRVITFKDINIEIVGSWIWIDGTTFPYKDQLKE